MQVTDYSKVLRLVILLSWDGTKVISLLTGTEGLPSRKAAQMCRLVSPIIPIVPLQSSVVILVIRVDQKKEKSTN